MKEVFIERREDFLRIAVKENDRLVECMMEEESREPAPGEIYKGIVRNIVPAMKCAFIDIGTEKNCYMYLDKKFNNLNIKKNQEVMVEIIKESVGDKGPKVSSAVTMAGRYSVLETLQKDISFSKKIASSDFKQKVLESLNKPEDIGVMIRTNAEKVPVETIASEVNTLYETYKKISREAQYSVKPKLLYQSEGILGKILRNVLDSATDSVITDNEEDYLHIKEFLKSSPELNIKLQLYSEARSLFSFYGIEKEILALRTNRVNLGSGAYIVIDKTESMYAIDVNTGRNTKGTSMEETIFQTNLEAAKEIGRQIILRNLSGIIVIDFIDMQSREHKHKVMEALTSTFEKDKSKPVIYPFTELNLVQLARRRSSKSITEYIEEDCSCCRGRGKRIRFEYLTQLIRNEILKFDAQLGAENVYLELNNYYNSKILNDIEGFIKNIEAENKKIYVKFVEEADYFKVEPLIFPNHIENMQKYKIYG